MNIYLRRYSLRLKNFESYIYIFSHPAKCTRILLSALLFTKKYLRTFDVIPLIF